MQMDKSERIRLIQQVRDELDAQPWEDMHLILGEFGFERLGDGLEVEPLTNTLSRGSDDDLISIASHFTAQSLPTEITPAADPSEPIQPLLVFASHLADHRALAGQVADELQRWGIELFVAHTSIEPDQEWFDEIIKKLDEANAGVAFLHQGFKESAWCDQEIGWLLGRRVPTFSLMFDQAPYGPLGQRQAIRVRDDMDSEAIAAALIESMMGRTELHASLASSFVDAMRHSRAFNRTDRIWRHLRDLRNLNAEQCATLFRALEQNTQVYWAASPWDNGSSYQYVVPAFLAKQPGYQAVQTDVEAYIARLAARDAD
jgi:TIR domain